MNIRKTLMIILLFILIAPTIYGIGIGLWVQEVQFTPNFNQNFNAFINNNGAYDTKVKLQVRGSLAEYVTFSHEYLDIPAGGRGFFTFNLKLPESIPPGRNRLDIGAIETTSEGGGISAKTAVFMGFFVRAPYPGKYIDASLNTENIEKDQIAIFNIDIISRGKETISKVDGIIEIFNQEEKIVTLTLDPEMDVKSEESRTIEAKWDAKGQPVGQYTAKAYLNYDGEELKLDTNFKIGTLLVKIINYTKEFYKDEINKFDIELGSFWNTNIDDVYGEIEIGKEKITTLKATIAPWSKLTITAYLDTQNLNLGPHTGSIKVYYADKVAEETAKITVLPEKKIIELPSQIPSTTILLIAIIILLVIGNILLVLHYLKKGKKPEKKTKKK